ncbi:hypothetical protein, partial [Bauldia litoralis]
MNRSSRVFGGLRAVFFALAVACCVSPAAALDGLTDQDLATVRVNIVDLLASEPNLPLPVRQRQEALAAYYAGQDGELLWLGQERAPAFIEWMRSAADDGLDPTAYP